MAPVVLVVDDSMLIRHTVCRYLEARGLGVESAVNGAEALERVAAVRPDLIITDLQMPRMTGSELISELKASAATAGIPVVVLAAKRTASSAPEEQRADFVIYKDIDIESQLKRVLEATVGGTAKA
jgi:CheY-like chemotaxis protein